MLQYFNQMHAVHVNSLNLANVWAPNQADGFRFHPASNFHTTLKVIKKDLKRKSVMLHVVKLESSLTGSVMAPFIKQ